MDRHLETSLRQVQRLEAELHAESQRLRERLDLAWQDELARAYEDKPLPARPYPHVGQGRYDGKCSARCSCHSGVDMEAELARLFPARYATAGVVTAARKVRGRMAKPAAERRERVA